MTIETQEELFTDHPAPWNVEKFQRGYAAVVDARGATVMTVNGVALAEFIADAANAFASDEYVFIASDNNLDKINVLTIQRDEAREQLAAANAELARIREWLALQNLCGKTAWEMVYEYTGLVAGHDAEVAVARKYVMNANARIEQLEAALRFYAESPAMGEIARAALADVVDAG